MAEWASTEDHAPVAGGWASTDDHSAADGPVMSALKHGAQGVGDVLTGLWNTVSGTSHREEIENHLKNGDYGKAALTVLKQSLGPGYDAIVAPAIDQATKAVDYAKHGRYSEAAGHGLAAVVPGVGPMAASLADTATGEPEMPPGQQVESPHEGQPARAVGQAATMLALEKGVPPVVEGIANVASKGIDKGIDVAQSVYSGDAITPEQQKAVDFAARKDIPLTTDISTQNNFLKGSKNLLAKQPFTAAPIARATNVTEAAMAKTGSDIASEVGPGAAQSRLTAGMNVVDRLRQRVEDLRGQQNEAGVRLREIAERPENVKQVQTGTKQSEVLDDKGNPIETPVMENISGPTDYASTKAAVKPILDRMEKNIPEAQKQASPGLGVLRQIMSRPDTVSLDTALGDLSAINNIGWNEIPAMRSISQGLGTLAGKPLRAAINDAAGGMGNDAVSALGDLRKLTGQKKDLASTLKANMKANPVALVKRLVANEDGGVKLLQTIARETPESVPDIARSTLEHILKNATNKGGFRNVESTAKMWDDIGPETKEILYPNHVVDLNSLFKLGRMVGENVNPSGSASVGGIMASGAALFHNPVLAVASILGANRMARFLTEAKRLPSATAQIPASPVSP